MDHKRKETRKNKKATYINKEIEKLEMNITNQTYEQTQQTMNRNE